MRLTKRDAALLAFLSEQGVATAGQLAREFFSSRNAFFIRIRILIQHEYVESVSIYKHRDALRSRFQDLYQILGSAPGAPNFRLYRLGQRFNSGQRPNELSTPIFWQHQITLNELRSILRPRLPKSALILSDPEIRSEWARFRLGSEVPIPDLEIRIGKKSIAIELERTKKTNLRYFERFAAYNRSHYEQVIYISENESIRDALIQACRRFPKVKVTGLSNLGKLFSHFDGYLSFEAVTTDEKSG